MKRKIVMVLCAAGVLSLAGSSLAMAGEKTEAVTEESGGAEEKADVALEDGVYTAEFETDSNMFHVNEANDGKGTLTVEDGKMTIHVSLVGRSRNSGTYYRRGNLQ